MSNLRLLLDPPASGAWNMAVDEALLETTSTSGQATLRFYQWKEPTLSLGYFQSVAEREQHFASRECPLVRRASGGGALLHDRELTYSTAIPERDPRSAAGALYEIFHQTLAATLGELGVSAQMPRATTANCRSNPSYPPEGEPFLCFQRRSCSDITCGDAKIVGSAQRRRRGAVLQHGSILLARSPFAPELPGIWEVAGVRLEPAELARRWTPRLADRLSVAATAGTLTGAEADRAAVLAGGRFSAHEYLQRR